jgi:hypothetical protein
MGGQTPQGSCGHLPPLLRSSALCSNPAILEGFDVVVNQYIDHLQPNVQAIIKASDQHIKE